VPAGGECDGGKEDGGALVQVERLQVLQVVLVDVIEPEAIEQDVDDRAAGLDGGSLDLPRLNGEAFAQHDAVRSNCAGLM
jgi:hypothetical protein